jgi:type IV secretory pathway protease TraF
VLIVVRTRAVGRGDVIAYRAPNRARARCGAEPIFVHRVQRAESGRRLYVIGDNRPQSCDSRVFGSVPIGNVIGKVVGAREG